MIKFTKKICSLILSSVIIISLFVYSFAVENVTIYSDNITAVAGETVSVSIKAANNTGFMGFGILLEFDDSVFTPVSVNSGDMLANGSLTDSIGGNMQDNIVKVVYTDSSNVTDNGVLFNVVFDVSDYAVGDQQIKISFVSKDTFDENFDTVNFSCGDFSVFVENEYVENAVKFGGGSLSANAGEQISVPVYVNNANALTDFTLTLNYDNSIFGFKENQSDFVDEVFDNGDGSITFICNNVSINADNPLALTVVFDVAEYVELQEMINVLCSSATANGNAVEVICSDIIINIANPYANEPAFIYSNDFIEVTDGYVDVPVYINNNHGIMGFGIDVAYDNAIFEPVSVTKGDILSNGIFEDNVENTSDTIKIRWNNSSDVIDNGLLFTLRFAVLDDEDLTTAPIILTCSQPDTYNENWEDVELDINIDSITIKKEHTLRFFVDGVVISTQKFVYGTSVSEIDLPQIPERSGYTGKWKNFILTNDDVDVDCVYTPNVYTATFVNNGNVIGTDTFTVEDESLDYPLITERIHYNWEWDDHKIEANNLTIEGSYIPITYTITFVSNGNVVKTQEYNVETVDLIVAPAKSFPEKEHYTIEWEDWTGKIGSITVNEIYAPIQYIISFYCQNRLAGTCFYTVETEISLLQIPEVPEVNGYTVEWPEINLEYKDQTINAFCTPIVYTAQFVADGVVIDTQTFTVETSKLNEPDIPPKAGYIAVWSYYVLGAKNITIHAKYYLPTVIMKARATVKVDESIRLLTSCNFDTTRKTWSSSDPSVATVDSYGKVTAVGKGECKIYVTCYGEDSFGNEIKATGKTEIIVKGQLDSESFKEWFRAAFDEFFQEKLHEILYNFREFMIIVFRYAY